MSVRSAAALLVISALVDALGARLLDSLGLIEGILSPGGARIVLLLPVATLFFAARLCCYFVAPGLLLGAVLDSIRLRFWLPPPQLTSQKASVPVAGLAGRPHVIPRDHA